MRAAAITLAALLLGLAGPVGASALSVTPVRLVLSPAAPLGTFTVVNEGTTPARVQLTLNQWKQAGGADVLTPVRDVLVNPTIFEVAGSSRQLVRLGLQVPPGDTERSYRLISEEIPSAEQLRAGSVGVRLRISVPLFVPVDGAIAELGWRLAAKGDACHLSVANSGRRHAQIVHLKLTRADGAVLFDGNMSYYILPGATMPGEVKLTTAPTPGETLRIDAKTDNGDVHANVRVDAL